MEKRKLQTKDLITVGIFTAIYYVLFFAVGMIGYVPIFYVVLPVILPIVCGIPFMLFLTKVRAFGMVTIMGTILGGLMVITGYTFLPIVAGFAFGLIADLIFMAGNYQSKKLSVLGYSVFSFWILGITMVPFWVMRESFENMMLDSMGVEYTRAVLDNFDTFSWAFPILVLIGGALGAFLGLAMLTGVINRMGPSLFMGYYLLTTTTVSEFIAAMERVRLPKQIIIYLRHLRTCRTPVLGFPGSMARFLRTPGLQRRAVSIANDQPLSLSKSFLLSR